MPKISPEFRWQPTTYGNSPPQQVEAAGSFLLILDLQQDLPFCGISAITNIPTSSITGECGAGTRSSIAGLTNPEVIGIIYAADDPIPVPAMLIQAKTDAEAAYLDAVSAVRGVPIPLSRKYQRFDTRTGTLSVRFVDRDFSGWKCYT